jgi:hypothetical protein
LPKGKTTPNVTDWIIDRDTNAIVSQVVLIWRGIANDWRD